MKTNKRLEVFYKRSRVGTLALTADKRAAFEYDDAWIEHGFSISPFSLPLRKQVFVPTKSYFGGLFGVFADSLPDAWGNILLGRIMKQNGIRVDSLNILDRLAVVGDSGMGALSYRPEMGLNMQSGTLDLDYLAEQCSRMLRTEYVENLDELYHLGGTSGGARPKIMTKIDGEDWLIKFPAHVDGKDIGQMEYDYSICAVECGISMTPTRLFPSKQCKGYFGTKRFDRISGKNDAVHLDDSERVHMISAAALLELDFEQPSMDYHALMKLTKILTRDNPVDVENMFRRMCFNVFAHNRDDHSKNFSYLYDEEKQMWRLSPAYDLTYSSTYYGEHTTTVDGNGSNPGRRELLNVGIAAGLKKRVCDNIISEIQDCTQRRLGQWLSNQ